MKPSQQHQKPYFIVYQPNTRLKSVDLEQLFKYKFRKKFTFKNNNASSSFQYSLIQILFQIFALIQTAWSQQHAILLSKQITLIERQSPILYYAILPISQAAKYQQDQCCFGLTSFYKDIQKFIKIGIISMLKNVCQVGSNIAHQLDEFLQFLQDSSQKLMNQHINKQLFYEDLSLVPFCIYSRALHLYFGLINTNILATIIGKQNINYSLLSEVYDFIEMEDKNNNKLKHFEDMIKEHQQLLDKYTDYLINTLYLLSNGTEQEKNQQSIQFCFKPLIPFDNSKRAIKDVKMSFDILQRYDKKIFDLKISIKIPAKVNLQDFSTLIILAQQLSNKDFFIGQSIQLSLERTANEYQPIDPKFQQFVVINLTGKITQFTFQKYSQSRHKFNETTINNPQLMLELFSNSFLFANIKMADKILIIYRELYPIIKYLAARTSQCSSIISQKLNRYEQRSFQYNSVLTSIQESFSNYDNILENQMSLIKQKCLQK